MRSFDRRRLHVVVLFSALSAAACSQHSTPLAPIVVGSSTSTPGVTPTPGTTPSPTPAATATPSASGPPSSAAAFLAAITPAPGYPSPVGAAWTPDPNLTAPPQPVQPTPYLGSAGFSSDDLVNDTPDQLLAALAPDIVSPARTLVVGNLIGFAPPDGIVIATRDDTLADPAASPVPIDISDAQPATITLHVGGTTIDGVAGGFGALRTGDAVLAGLSAPLAGADATAAYVTSVAGVGAQLPALAHRLAARARANDGAASALRRSTAAMTYANSNMFRMEGKSPKAKDVVFPFGPYCPPLPTPFGASICVSGNGTYAFGSFAEYPMLLDDARDNPYPYVVNQSGTVPLVITNNPSAQTLSGLTRYSISAFGALTVTGTATVSIPAVGQKTFTGTKKYEVGFQTSTAKTLPGAGASATVDVLNSLNGQFDSLAFVCLAVQKTAAPVNPVIIFLDGLCFGNQLGPMVGVPIAYKASVTDSIAGGNLLAGTIQLSNSAPSSGSNLVFPIDTGVAPNFIVTPLLSAQNNVVPQGVNVGNIAYQGDDNPQLSLAVSIGVTAKGVSVVPPVMVGTIGPAPLRQIVPLADVLQTMRNVSDPVNITLYPKAVLAIPCTSTISYNGNPITKQNACASYVDSRNGAIYEHGTVTVMDLPSETSAIKWDPSFNHIPGSIQSLYQSYPPCSSAVYAGLYSVTPAFANGPTATFDFEPVGPNAEIMSTNSNYTQCIGEFYDLDGNYAVTILNWTVVPPNTNLKR